MRPSRPHGEAQGQRHFHPHRRQPEHSGRDDPAAAAPASALKPQGPRPAALRLSPETGRVRGPDAFLDLPRRLRLRARGGGAQSARRGRRRAARRADRVHRRVRLGEVLARLRDDLRGGAAALLRVGDAVRAAAARPAGRAEGARHHRPAAGDRPAAAARRRDLALQRRHRDDALELPADALLPRRDLPAGGRRGARLRLVLAEHRDRRLPRVPRPRHRAPHHRRDARPRSVADDPRARGRRLARRLAGPEPARHPGHAGLRHRQAVEKAAAQGPRMDPLHRRAADRRSPPRPRRSRCRLLLQRHLLERRTTHPPHPGELGERGDAAARPPVRGNRPVPGVSRQAAAAGGARGHLRRP